MTQHPGILLLGVKTQEKCELMFTQNPCAHVYSSFIHYNPKAETSQLSFNSVQINKL